MNQLEASAPCSSVPFSENGRRRIIVGICLAISLLIHLIAIAVVFTVTLQPDYRPSVTYIDINSIAEPVSSGEPAIHSPRLQPRDVMAENSVPLPATPAEPLPEEPPAPPLKPSVDEIRATSLDRGIAQGYFSSFAEGKNLRDDIREYYFHLLEKINSNWWLKAENLKEAASHDGVVMFTIGRDGALLDAKLIKSSGSRLVDKAIIEVLKETSPYPPLPASYSLERFQAPLKIAAPLRLFSIRSLR